MADSDSRYTISSFASIGGYIPSVQHQSLAEKMSALGGVSPLDVLSAASKIQGRH
jgi:hypothetical protein